MTQTSTADKDFFTEFDFCWDFPWDRFQPQKVPPVANTHWFYNAQKNYSSSRVDVFKISELKRRTANTMWPKKFLVELSNNHEHSSYLLKVYLK